MHPAFPVNDCGNSVPTNFKLAAKISANNSASRESPDFDHLFVAQFGAWVIGAASDIWHYKCGQISALSFSAFSHLIGGIFLGCSKPKMGRIATKSIVAAMAHAKVVWNWTIGKFPSQSVRSITSGASVSVSAISANGGFSPRPAFVWPLFINIIPKPSHGLFECELSESHKKENDRQPGSKVRKLSAATRSAVVKLFEFTIFCAATLRPSPLMAERLK